VGTTAARRQSRVEFPLACAVLAIGQEPRNVDWCRDWLGSPAVVGAVIAVWVILAIAALGANFVRRKHGKERG